MGQERVAYFVLYAGWNSQSKDKSPYTAAMLEVADGTFPSE
jgi:hypothetical protein